MENKQTIEDVCLHSASEFYRRYRGAFSKPESELIHFRSIRIQTKSQYRCYWYLLTFLKRSRMFYTNTKTAAEIQRQKYCRAFRDLELTMKTLDITF